MGQLAQSVPLDLPVLLVPLVHKVLPELTD
jgi:hypothetical protein